MSAAVSLRLYPKQGGGFILTDPAVLPTCTLTKMRTTDGRFEYIEGRAFIGKQYKYLPKSRRVAWLTDQPTGVDYQCEIVLAFDEAGYFAMMPVECLSFP